MCTYGKGIEFSHAVVLEVHGSLLAIMTMIIIIIIIIIIIVIIIIITVCGFTS